MFTFRRETEKPAELWPILLGEGIPDGVERFGEALRHNARGDGEGPACFHDVGVLCAFSTSDGAMQYVLTCRDGLTAVEENTLYAEVELLLGREVHQLGGEKQKGWFVRDALK